jgi:hypothetical protein
MNWWDSSYVQVPKYIRPWRVEDGLWGTARIEVIGFKRERWAFPPDYDRHGYISKVYTVRGVPGTVYHAGGWYVPAWRCQICKAFFIVGEDFQSLRHSCTEQVQSGTGVLAAP